MRRADILIMRRAETDINRLILGYNNWYEKDRFDIIPINTTSYQLILLYIGRVQMISVETEGRDWYYLCTRPI